MTTLTISLPQKEKNRLTRIAGKFGVSLSELSRHVLAEISESIPLESIEEYENPIALKQSLRRAYRDIKNGRVHATL